MIMTLFDYQIDDLLKEKYWIHINRNIEYLECKDCFVIRDDTFDYIPSTNLKILIKNKYCEKIMFKSNYIRDGDGIEQEAAIYRWLAYDICIKQTKDGFYVLFDTKNELVNFTLRNRDL